MNREERNKLIEDNMKLVPYVANKYFKVYISMSEEKREDFMSEGYAYLCKAADRYNPELGYKFSTYATKYIWGSMSRYIKYRIRDEQFNNKEYSLENEIPGTEKVFMDVVPDKNRDKDINIIELKDFLSRNLKIKNSDRFIALLENENTCSSIAREMEISQQWANKHIRDLRKLIKNEYLIS